jgi:hypothetical protein
VFNPDDTDGDGIPNFFGDDDGDGLTTKLEITKTDGTLYPFNDISVVTENMTDQLEVKELIREMQLMGENRKRKCFILIIWGVLMEIRVKLCLCLILFSQSPFFNGRYNLLLNLYLSINCAGVPDSKAIINSNKLLWSWMMQWNTL